jgi:hypothetical protein
MFSQFSNYGNFNKMASYDVSKTLQRLSYLENEEDKSPFFKNVLTPFIYDEDLSSGEDNYNIEENLYGMHIEEDQYKTYFYNNNYNEWKTDYDEYLERVEKYSEELNEEEVSQRLCEEYSQGLSEEVEDTEIYKLYLNALTNNLD